MYVISEEAAIRGIARNTVLAGDFPKLIAAIAMVIDHIGWLFFPESDMWRIVGRISFPVFAWYAAAGYARTRNLQKYLYRLFIAGLVSQIPYMFISAKVNSAFGLNIMFTLLLGLMAIYAWEEQKRVLFIMVLLVSFVPFVDYPGYGALLILLFYRLRSSCNAQLAAFAGLTFLFGFLWDLQVYAVFVILLFFMPKRFDQFQFRLPRYFFYVFYPGHLLLLAVILWYLRA